MLGEFFFGLRRRVRQRTYLWLQLVVLVAVVACSTKSNEATTCKSNEQKCDNTCAPLYSTSGKPVTCCHLGNGAVCVEGVCTCPSGSGAGLTIDIAATAATPPTPCSNGTTLVFSPNPGTVKQGQSVVWHNSDSVAHTIDEWGGTQNPSIPLTTAPPGGDSGEIAFSVGTHTYLAEDCNPKDNFGAPLLTGKITVTVN